MMNFIEHAPALCKAVLIAVVMAFIRVSRDDEPRLVRSIIEAIFCGAITVVAFYGVRAVGLSNYEDYAVFAGGCIGMLGSDFVRGMARKIAASRAK